MKTNLKTFPTMAKNLSELVQKRVDWKENFEKELRERLNSITFRMSVSERMRAYAHLLVELLGEQT